MAVITGIMELYIKEVLIPIKVFEVVRRFAAVGYPEEVPVDAEDAAVLWLNKSSIKMRHRIEDHLGTCHAGDDSDNPQDFRPLVPYIPVIGDLSDLNDGCALTALLSFYCPNYLPWEELCLNDPMSLADSLYNLQLVQRFCETHLPHDVCFLTVEDMLFLHPSIRHNVLAFLADLMYIFEIRPPKCVRRPGLRYQEPTPQQSLEAARQNGRSLRKARALQNSYSHIPDLCAETGNSVDGSYNHNGAWQGKEGKPEGHQRSSVHERPRVPAIQRSHSVREEGDSDGAHLSSSPKSRSRSDDDDDLAGYFVRRHVAADAPPREPLQPARLRESKERSNHDAKHMERGEDASSSGPSEPSPPPPPSRSPPRRYRRSGSRTEPDHGGRQEVDDDYNLSRPLGRSSSRTDVGASPMHRSASKTDLHEGSGTYRSPSRSDLGQGSPLHRNASRTDLQNSLRRSSSKSDLQQQTSGPYKSASKSELQGGGPYGSPSQSDVHHGSPLHRNASRSDIQQGSPLHRVRTDSSPLHRGAPRSDAHPSPVRRSPSRPDLRGTSSREAEAPVGRNSALESYYDQLGGQEGDAEQPQKGAAGFPLRREPSLSHVLNFSGEKAALEMTDPFETDMFAQHREKTKKQTTSFAQLSKEGSASGINIVYMQQEGGRHPARRKRDDDPKPGGTKTTWQQQADGASTDAARDASDSAPIATQLSNVRIKLEERRRKIEQEKRRVEERVKRQRQKAGKAAFLQVVSKGREDAQQKSPESAERSATKEGAERQPSLKEITENIDSVRRKWLDGSAEVPEKEDPSPDDENVDLDDCVSSIDRLNTSLTDLDEDLLRLDRQQRAIQSMLHGDASPKPAPRDRFFLHDGAPHSAAPSAAQQPPPQLPQQPAQQQSLQQTLLPQQPIYQSSYQQQPTMSAPPVHASYQHPQSAMPQQRSFQPPYQQTFQQPPARRQWNDPVPPQVSQMFHHPNSQPQNSLPPQYQQHPPYEPPRRGQWGPPVVEMAERPPRQQWGPPVYPVQQQYQQEQQQQQPQYGNQSFVLYPERDDYGGQYGGYPMPPGYCQNGTADQRQPANDYPTFSMPQYERPPQYGTYVQQQEAETQPVTSQLRPRAEAVQRQVSAPRGGSDRSEASDDRECTETKAVADDLGQLRLTDSVPASPSKKGANYGKTYRVTRSGGPGAQPTGQRDGEGRGPAGDAGFFISFDDEQPKKPKPKLRPRIARRDGDESPSSGVSSLAHEAQGQSGSSSGGKVPGPVSFSVDVASDAVPREPPGAHRKSAEEDEYGAGGNSGIGFVIGADLVNPDPDAETEMQRRKEMIMMVCLKRKEEQEANRIAKEQANAAKRMREQQRREEQERKREEEKQRRQLILEQYRLRKAREEAEKNGAAPASSNPSSRNATLTRPKPRSSSKPRPKSVHIGAHQASQLGSLPYHPLSGRGSQVNLHECRGDRDGPRRAPSPPPSTCSAASDGFRPHGGAASDGASDTASTTSSLLPYGCTGEYTGPKLFVKPTAKSNRGIVLNAVNTVLAGAVNADTKAKVVEEINQSESKHFLILFRDAGCQFRGLYSYNPDRDEVFRLYGVGPKSVTGSMMDLFFKYNSGAKSFTRIHTKHLTVTIDAFTIHNHLWSAKRPPAQRKDP